MKKSEDHLGEIRLFIAINESGSLTVAARKFGYSVPAASIKLAKLEKRLNVKLFNRSTRKLCLTNEGQEYLEKCIEATQIIDSAELMIKSKKELVGGSIRVSVPTDFCRGYFLNWLGLFEKLYPDVKISLSLDDSYSNRFKR